MSTIQGNRHVYNNLNDARWSSPVAREAHNLEVVSSNLARATLFHLQGLGEAV